MTAPATRRTRSDSSVSVASVPESASTTSAIASIASAETVRVSLGRSRLACTSASAHARTTGVGSDRKIASSRPDRDQRPSVTAREGQPDVRLVRADGIGSDGSTSSGASLTDEVEGAALAAAASWTCATSADGSRSSRDRRVSRATSPARRRDSRCRPSAGHLRRRRRERPRSRRGSAAGTPPAHPNSSRPVGGLARSNGVPARASGPSASSPTSPHTV